MINKEKVLATFDGKKNEVYRRHEIIDKVLQQFPDTNSTSIIPSDYCYNSINIDIEDRFTFHVFELIERGTYKYLGQNYPYNGLIYWKKIEVGEWKDGKIIRLNKLK